MTRIHRRVVSVILAATVFVLFGAFADRTLTYLQHAGFRSVPIMTFLAAAVLIAYIAFAAILYFASTTRRAITLHGSAAVITVIWFAFVLARSTLTGSG